MAPQTARRFSEAFSNGQLVCHKGRLTAIGEDGADLVLRYRSQDDRWHDLRAAHVINSSGPQFDIGRVDHPLVRSALQQGLARPDSLGLGLEVTSEFQLVGAKGQPVPGLMALGPLARGNYWELTAVPELRNHCAHAGRMLAAQLSSTPAAQGRV